MSKTKIPWATEAWNVVTGCTQCSPGCANCYAKRLIETRMKHLPRFKDGFKPTFHVDQLAEPTRWRKPRLVFVASLGDLFHPDITFRAITGVFFKMRSKSQHHFMVLTKRPERMREFMRETWKDVPDNVLLGTSVSTVDDLPNVDHLRGIHDCKRFVSVEPLLGRLSLKEFLPNLHWVIIGGESGTNARPCHSDWVRSIVDECRAANVPVFVKQAGKNHQGGGWDDILQIREVPTVLEKYFEGE